MTARQRDVKVRILSEYYDQGSKAAERATRRLASLQMAAAAEDARREQQKAAAIVAANRAQAQAMEATGRATLGVAGAIVVGLGLATKSAMDWESAFAGVRKVVDGSPEEISQLERELRGLTATLPATHEQIAGVAEAAGQLGVARQDIAAFTRTAINMGETTNMSADEAATSMAQLSNIMGLTATSANRLGSTIVALGNNGASTERDIVSMGLRIAGAGRTVGMTADQVLAVASALSSVGLEADAGGSAISRVMLRIDKDVRAGADTLATYADVAGVTAEEFSQAWGEDAASALTLFINGLGKAQSEGRDTNQILERLGFTELRVADALRRASLAGELLNNSLEIGSRAWRENNALTEEAARRYETTEARLQIARNRINDVAIDIGANFLPAVADAGEWVADLAEGFRALPPEAQEWIVKLGAVATGLTGVVGAAAIAIPKLIELKNTVDALQGGSSLLGKAMGGVAGVLTGPWGLALGAAVLAGGLWMRQQGEIRRNVQALTETLDEQTGAITENTRAKVIDRLQDRGVLEAAQKLGLELDRVTDAALGNAGAMIYVEQAVRAAYEASDQAAREERLTGALVEQANAAALLERQLSGQRAEVTESRAQWDLKQQALNAATDAAGRTADATSGLTEELEAEKKAAEDTSKALDDLARELRELNDPTLELREAEVRWVEQLSELDTLLKQNGRTLEINTEKGRENRRALDDLARIGMQRAEAVLQDSRSVEQFNATLLQEREQLFNVAKQFGMTDDEAQAYIDSVLSIPDTATTQAILDTTAAEQKLAWFKATLASNNVVITADMRAQGGYYANRARGSIDFMADGAIHLTRMSNQLATLVPSNTWRVVGDRRDGVPELFAPLDGSRRSHDLWQLAGQMMGWSTQQPPTVVVQAPPAQQAPSGPMDLSDRTVERLAAAIVAGAQRVTTTELEHVGARLQYAGRP